MKFWRALWSKQASYPIALLLAGAFGVGILFVGGFHTALEATNTTKFCISCHEMESTVYEEYKKSPHYTNAAGVRAECADCHVPQEFLPKMVRKFEARNDLLHHLLGTVDTPEKFEEHRLDMAQRVWARMEANDSATCRSCHAWDAMAFEKQHPEAAKQMQAGMQENQTCISCHKGIAHKMPDMSQGYKRLFEELVSAADEQTKGSDALVTLKSKNIYLDKGAAGSGGKPSGKLLPATEVAVVERSGDLLKVRLDGWQQDGVDRVVYAMRGQRIFSATIGKKNTGAVQKLKTETDADTELVWHQVNFEGWIKKGELVSDKDQLWGYAEEMYVASCATCHSRPDPAHYLANQWIGTLKAMKRFISIDKEQYRFLQKYLQLNAKDTGGAHHHG